MWRAALDYRAAYMLTQLGFDLRLDQRIKHAVTVFALGVQRRPVIARRQHKSPQMLLDAVGAYCVLD
jgi:hypothetical protein